MTVRATTQRAAASSVPLLLVAFVLLCVANGRWSVAPAAWVAPVMLLLFVQSRPAVSGLACAFLAQLLAFFVNWRGMIPVPGLWYYLVAGIYAAAYFLPYVVYRLIAPRVGGFRSTLVFPTCFVAAESLFQSLATPYGSWASPAYTQIDFGPLMQLASVTGLSGIHFVMTWTAAVVAWTWQNRTHFSRARTGVLTWGTVLLALLAWGQWRIVAAPDNTPVLRVAALTPSASLTRELQREFAALTARDSVDESSLAAVAEVAERLNDDLLERTRREARAGAEIVVWSEHAARVTRRTEPQLIEQAQALAGSFGVPLILGIGLFDPEAQPAFENKAVIIDAQGRLLGSYHKARPIVGQESGLIDEGAARIATMDSAFGLFGIVICHDLDFPGLLRDAGDQHVVVLVAPSSDWDAIAPLHARMAIARAVENGCSLVRPCSDGESLFADALGRIVASQIDSGDDGNVLVAGVPLWRLPTAYPAVADGFAYVNLLVLSAFLAGRFMATAKRRRATEGVAE